jgi:tetratricopeptide (TPR) repeat protein
MGIAFRQLRAGLLGTVTLVISSLLLFSTVLAQTAAEKERVAARAKELNSAVERDLSTYTSILTSVENGTLPANARVLADEIVRFRERWWGPKGIAATETKMSLYQAGSLSEAYLLRARIKFLLNDHSGALSDFASVLTKATEEERRQEGRVSEDDGRVFEPFFKHLEKHKTAAEQIADIDAVITSVPDRGILFMRRALLRQNPQEIISDLETALKLSPKTPYIYEVAVDMIFQLGERERGTAILEKATKEMPLLFRFHRLRADVLRGDLEEGDPKLALARLTKAIDECSCQRMRLYFYLRERAAVNFKLKNFDAVIQDSSRAIDISDAMSGGKPTTPLDDPDDWTPTVQPFFYRASALMAKGMYKEALPDLDQLVQSNGWGSDYELRAEARCKVGDIAGAKEDEAKAAADVGQVKNPCKAK